MGQKVEVSGTGYDLKGGKTLIGGTAYAVDALSKDLVYKFDNIRLEGV